MQGELGDGVSVALSQGQTRRRCFTGIPGIDEGITGAAIFQLGAGDDGVVGSADFQGGETLVFGYGGVSLCNGFSLPYLCSFSCVFEGCRKKYI